MIRYLQIENFKSLKKIGFPLERLNLMFGLNGMGKSSLIQALLLLRQSYWMNDKNNLNQLFFNGPLLGLGTKKDVFCQTRESQQIRFFIHFRDQCEMDCRYGYGEQSQLLDSVRKTGDISINSNVFNEALFSNENFVYLSADHISPQKEYSTENFNFIGINPLGNKGNYAVPFLARMGDQIQVPSELCIKSGRTSSLIDQTSAWMGRVSPEIRLFAQDNMVTQKASMRIRYEGSRLVSDDILPINTGYGISYVLPLIVALLTSNKDSLILVENPESHLHPRAQSAMAELLSRAAAHGAQIICESHSDHIINGVRVSVKNRIISENDLTVDFFSKNSDQETKVDNINIDHNGNLSEYPKGLLDEWGILMSQLI